MLSVRHLHRRTPARRPSPTGSAAADRALCVCCWQHGASAGPMPQCALFAARHLPRCMPCRTAVRAASVHATWRTPRGGRAVRHVSRCQDAEELDRRLQAMPGVVETGIFANMATGPPCGASLLAASPRHPHRGADQTPHRRMQWSPPAASVCYGIGRHPAGAAVAYWPLLFCCALQRCLSRSWTAPSSACAETRPSWALDTKRGTRAFRV